MYEYIYMCVCVCVYIYIMSMCILWASQVVIVAKNLTANGGDAGMWFWSLYWDDPLEESMATHSSILAWRIPWTEEPGGLWSIGSQSVGLNWSDLARMHVYHILSQYALLFIYYYFIQLKVCDNPLLSKSIGAILSTVLYLNEGIYMIFF